MRARGRAASPAWRVAAPGAAVLLAAPLRSGPLQTIRHSEKVAAPQPCGLFRDSCWWEQVGMNWHSGQEKKALGKANCRAVPACWDWQLDRTWSCQVLR